MAHYDWATLYEKLESCTDCGLCKGRTNVVIGVGNPQSKIMLIGEGPGRDEDIQGYPFVGAAGQLLDKMLAAISLDRTKVYIANIVKCRPPQNRTPLEDEAMACLPYLRAQVALIQPQIIVCLGKTAAMYAGPRHMAHEEGHMDAAHLPPRRPSARRKQKARRLARYAVPQGQNKGTGAGRRIISIKQEADI